LWREVPPGTALVLGREVSERRFRPASA
jgi:hypothetical protein